MELSTEQENNFADVCKGTTVNEYELNFGYYCGKELLKAYTTQSSGKEQGINGGETEHPASRNLI